jgi:hypothetical protein
VTAKRILRHPLLDRRGKPVKAFAHIGSTGRQLDAGARRQTHNRNSSITCRSVSGETSPRRQTRAPLPKVISITPLRRKRDRGSPVRSGASSTGCAISTGSIATLSSAAGSCSDVISRRNLNSWLALTSCRRAAIETDAPGSSVSATIRRFDISGQCRRFPVLRRRLVSTKPVVDTSVALSAMTSSSR